MENPENGEDREHAELAAHKAALERIEQRISEIAERGKPKLTRSGMFLAEKVRFIRENGEIAYLALPMGEPGPRR